MRIDNVLHTRTGTDLVKIAVTPGPRLFFHSSLIRLFEDADHG